MKIGTQTYRKNYKSHGNSSYIDNVAFSLNFTMVVVLHDLHTLGTFYNTSKWRYFREYAMFACARIKKYAIRARARVVKNNHFRAKKKNMSRENV